MNSSNGFQTNVWGAPAWLFMHCISLNYNPLKQKKDYIKFFKSLAGVLPCGSCRNNYRNTIKHHSTLKLTASVFDSRESLAFWLFKLHNYVTKCTLKGTPMYTNSKTDFKKMVALYENFRAKCPSNAKARKNQIHTKHGCTQAIKGGIRLRSVISVKPLCTSRHKSSIIFCSK